MSQHPVRKQSSHRAHSETSLQVKAKTPWKDCLHNAALPNAPPRCFPFPRPGTFDWHSSPKHRTTDKIFLIAVQPKPENYSQGIFDILTRIVASSKHLAKFSEAFCANSRAENQQHLARPQVENPKGREQTKRCPSPRKACRNGGSRKCGVQWCR